MKIPVINHGDCSLCGGCIAVCPEVFSLNDTGFINVADMDEYPEESVNEAIALCPEDCIYWEGDETGKVKNP